MAHKISKKVIACILVLAFVLQSIPLVMFMVSGAGEQVNLLQDHLDSSRGVKYLPNSRTVDYSTGSVTKNMISSWLDGNTVNGEDINSGPTWDPPQWYGVEFTLDDVYETDVLTIYAGLPALPDTYCVYASDSPDTLYTDKSLVDGNVSGCTGEAREVEIGRQVKYVAVLFNGETDYHRPKEFELWGAAEEEPVQTENLFRREDGSNAIESSRGVKYLPNSRTVDYSTGSVTKNMISSWLDGNTVNGEDINSGPTWDPPQWYGVEFTLDDVYETDVLTIYAGLPALPDTYCVYASDSPDTLYTDKSLVDGNVSGCTGEAREVEIGRPVKYVAVLFNGETDYHRPKEFELWGVAEEEPSESDNLFHKADGTDSIESSRGITMNAAQGYVKDKDTIDQTVIGGLTDGNLTDKYDLQTSTEWYYGVEFRLDGEYYADHLTIYAASDPADTYRVYASAALESLYTAESLVKDGVSVPANTATDVEIGENVRYVAVLSTVPTGNARPTEFQLWGGAKEEEPDTGAVKVLTIGNSFSENASSYATEIAQNQGYDLTFAYLKLSSGTIDQHWTNAQNNTAAYKFAYTDSTGRHNIKEEGSAGATIQEALEYMDWDIIVFQQGSTASDDYATYSNLGNLIDYVQQFCPDAQLMIHETWSWASWPAERFDDIEAAYHRAAQENGNLPVIHTGRAFEFARTALDSRTILNESDNQHANAYGKFVAGASYVAAIFGCDITDNTFVVTDSSVEGTVDMAILRKAVMDAMDYVPGDEIDTSLIAGKNPAAFGVATENNKKPVEGGSSAAVGALTDGLRDRVEFWGGKDINNTRFSFIYHLGANYDLTGAEIQAAADAIDTEFNLHKGIKSATIYASRYYADLLNEENGVVVKAGYESEDQADSTATFTAEAPASWQGARYVAFVITIGDSQYGACRLEELKVYGTRSAVQDPAETIPEEPDVYSGIIAGMEAMESGLAYDDLYHPTGSEVNSVGEHGSLALTDGSLVGIEYWGGKDVEGSRFVFIYNLGANYDLTDATIFGTVDSIDTEFNLHRGIKTATIYASRYYDDLFGEASGVVVKDGYESDDISVADTNSVFTAQAPASWQNARYVAFVITIGDSQYGACRLREFQVNGTRSAVQDAEEEIPTGPVRKPSIIEGLEADYYGVATDDLADPVYAGASQGVGGLTDGIWEDMEFWGGKDTENSCFVFIYDLYGNYDLTGAAIDSVRDTLEGATGVHKGIETATIYASRTFENLFAEGTGVVAKSGYEDPSRTDRATNFEITAPDSWKMARYVAFVITIDDSTYGACRLQELQVYGTLSATQDEEPEEERLPQYLDIQGDNGVILRLFQKDGRDDLAALGAKLVVTLSQEAADLDPVTQQLGGRYDAEKLYTVKLVDASGKEIPLDGRIVRLSFPAEEDTSVDWRIACVDDYGAEIISNSVQGDSYTVETETLRSYAMVKAAGAAGGSGDEPAAAASVLPTVLWAVAIVLGVLAVGGITLTVVAAVRRGKGRQE